MSQGNKLSLNLPDLIAPRFYAEFADILGHCHTDYYFNGGRGSTKSSFISIALVCLLMQDPSANSVVLRRVADTLRTSVMAQVEWAIDRLGVGGEWRTSRSTLEMTRLSTGQKIYFRGTDNPEKIKSFKIARGYANYIWFEEFTEFRGVEDIRSIRQSLGRGGPQLFIYSYNPPRSQRDWANGFVSQEALRPDALVHKSTYRTVPKEWLGEKFLQDAQALKLLNPTAYRHEYLGEVTGTGAEVFPNLVQATLTDQQVSELSDQPCRGLDFGFAADPLAYVEWHHDPKRHTLTALREVYGTGLSNRTAVEAIKKLNPGNGLVTADSAEPRTIAEFRGLGLRIRPCKKGPGSIEHGIKWLQDLSAIVVDPVRTPSVWREFSQYELETDARGQLRGDYPDRDNHAIDATRYSVEHLLRPKTTIKW